MKKLSINKIHIKSFSMVLGLLIAVLLLLPTPKTFAATFIDVPASHSNYEDITFLLEKGVISSSGKAYGIKDIVTREEVAVMVAKAVGLDGASRTTKFSDVAQSNKNSGYIQSAVEAGIINGYDDGTFKPNAKVTRGHMAAFIARAFNLPSGSKTFKDVPKGHTAYEAVQKLAAATITTGYEDGTFKPSNNLTRAHISAFLARAIHQVEGTEETVVVPTPEPTKPAVTEAGKTRNTAAKLNQKVLININDRYDGVQKYELTLNAIVSGDEAWTMIKKANMFNDEPGDGMKYVLAKFKVKVLSLEKEPFDIHHAHFDAVSKTGSMYNDFIAIVAPSPKLDTDLYSDAEYEGWTFFLVNEDDSPKVVYKNGRDVEAWFDLGL